MREAMKYEYLNIKFPVPNPRTLLIGSNQQQVEACNHYMEELSAQGWEIKAMLPYEGAPISAEFRTGYFHEFWLQRAVPESETLPQRDQTVQDDVPMLARIDPEICEGEEEETVVYDNLEYGQNDLADERENPTPTWEGVSEDRELTITDISQLTGLPVIKVRDGIKRCNQHGNTHCFYLAKMGRGRSKWVTTWEKFTEWANQMWGESWQDAGNRQ